jgi:hypothetical protein
MAVLHVRSLMKRVDFSKCQVQENKKYLISFEHQDHLKVLNFTKQRVIALYVRVQQHSCLTIPRVWVSKTILAAGEGTPQRLFFAKFDDIFQFLALADLAECAGRTAKTQIPRASSCKTYRAVLCFFEKIKTL